MVRLSPERVLLIGDEDRQMYATIAQGMPTAHVRSVATLFDAIAELAYDQYTTVLAAAEPMERRPEAAVKTLRELGGDSRLLLYGHPTLEPLSQKMMDFGADDYLVTPVTAGDLLQVMGARKLRLQGSGAIPDQADKTLATSPAAEPEPDTSIHADVPLTEIVLESLVKSPQNCVDEIVNRINAALPSVLKLEISAANAPAPSGAPVAESGSRVVTLNAPADTANGAENFPHSIHLLTPNDYDPAAAMAFLTELSRYLGSAQVLQDRHNSLQRMAITDDLTGVANGRYFRHFLAKIIEKAHVMCFPVTLFLFDIDNFKRYNDEYGHVVGDGILKQTAALMRRCVRDHDLVARISGDEFAVVFWEKEGPRQPRDARPVVANRTPKETQEILNRFRRLVSTQDFPGLGPGGKGCLTISGGIAVYPWNANDADGLIDAADKQLMFGAKRSGRNSIHLVGGECLPPPGNEPAPSNS
jgi:diguanylate cyclase (GGDEF)-like protein